MPHAAFMLHRIELPRFSFPRRLQQLALPVGWAAIIALIILPNKTFLPGVGLYPAYYPTAIYRFIENNVPPQNLFNEMRYGGSMLWWLYPKFRPFIDGRGDAYTPEFWQKEYLPVLRAEPGWREILRKYDAHGAILPIVGPGGVPKFGQALFDDPDWALVAYNDHTLLFLERTDLNQAVITQNEFKLVWPNDRALTAVTPENLLNVISEATRALKIAPDCRYALTVLARANMVAQDYAKAAELYAQLIAGEDAGEMYYRDYGYCLFILKQFNDAEKIFKAMIRRQQLAGFAHYMMHFIALERSDGTAAKEHILKAITLEPQNPEYKSALAQLGPGATR